jgi:hypothetical protein
MVAVILTGLGMAVALPAGADLFADGNSLAARRNTGPTAQGGFGFGAM